MTSTLEQIISETAVRDPWWCTKPSVCLIILILISGFHWICFEGKFALASINCPCSAIKYCYDQDVVWRVVADEMSCCHCHVFVLSRVSIYYCFTMDSRIFKCFVCKCADLSSRITSIHELNFAITPPLHRNIIICLSKNTNGYVFSMSVCCLCCCDLNQQPSVDFNGDGH